jgi:hypothetical protein
VSTSPGDRDAGATAVPGAPPRRGLPGPFLLVAISVLLVLHGLPWWRLVVAPQWPAAVTIAGTVVAVVAVFGFRSP